MESEILGDMLVKASKGKIYSEGIALSHDTPEINSITVNSNQMYFALGTKQGFEIISNDAACESL